MSCTSGSFSISSGVPSLKMRPLCIIGHTRRHSQRHVEIVLDDDVADMVRQRVEDRDQIAPLGRRQSGRRLVEQDEARRAGQRQRHFELPLLAVAQRRNQSRRAVPPDERQRLMRIGLLHGASSERGRSSESRRRETPRQAR